jgi:hypothetical protein
MALPFYPPPEGSRGHGPLLLFPFYPPSEGSKTYGPLPFAKPSGPGVDPSKIQGPICKEDCRVLGLRVDSCINQGLFVKNRGAWTEPSRRIRNERLEFFLLSWMLCLRRLAPRFNDKKCFFIPLVVFPLPPAALCSQTTAVCDVCNFHVHCPFARQF